MKRLILSPGTLLALFLSVLAFNIQAQDLNSATGLTRSEQYDKADAMLKELIQKEPSNSKNYFFLGENYLLDYFSDTISNSLTVAAKAAKEVYQKGVEANPNDPLNYVGLAKIAFYQGDDKTATEMRAKAKSFLLPYKSIKKINPPAQEYAFALAKIAESYIKDGEVDTALALPLIRQAITIDSKSRDIYLIAGDIYILVNDGSKAIANYNNAQFADPQSPTANMKIGNIYVKGRALNAAIPYFEQAIELNANYAPAYRELGQLYSLAQRFEQSKEYFKKYLDLTAGNIPAKTRYVNALFYAKEYDEVIKNVEEIFQVDKSRTYMNRIAGYSAFEKNPPDYDKALSYMETLFATVAPERIIFKDYNYMAKILLKKNQNYTKIQDELKGVNTQLESANSKYASAKAADKPKLKPAVDELTAKKSNLESEIAKADAEIDRAFDYYGKALEMKPDNRGLLSEIANAYYTYRRYDGAAKTWAKMIDPANEKMEDYMQIGRAYYNAESFKSADSVFSLVATKSPDYIQAYLWSARTYSKMDPDTKMGLAKPKFEKLIQVSQSDSLKNESEMMEAFGYLSYYYMMNDNLSTSKDFYNRMINLNPSNKENKIKGYNGLASLELRATSNEKTNEGRLPFLNRAEESYNKILEIDPNNASAKSQINYIREFEAAIKKGINPNEIKGTIKSAAGQPIAYASIRVKDTAAENLSNGKGEFKFEIPQSSEILIISAKGYKSKEVPITKTRVYNVTLEQ
ncbi:MAG TPA: carboxypeptidase-like regulatory domain-containing protein [Bacteroidales bacterium]|nr:carboxypeptidase-like regulatory domain-containing protein [Bacteroidales bacterium]